MSSTVLTTTSGRDIQGRSASGRNGGARKATSSNSIVMRFRLLDNGSVVFTGQSSKANRHDNSQQSVSWLRAVQFCTRSTVPRAASWSRGHFAIHVRGSSNCTHIYRSRWGRATCLSNWAQGLNMERLRAQAPWRSHTQTP